MKALIFDCDGVLFDTEAANWAYYNHILEHFGRPALTADQFAYAHQHTLNESIAHLFDGDESVAAVHAYRQTMDYGEFLKYLKVEPDLTPLLNKIRPRFKTAIATNRTDTVDRLNFNKMQRILNYIVKLATILSKRELGGLSCQPVDTVDLEITLMQRTFDELLPILKQLLSLENF